MKTKIKIHIWTSNWWLFSLNLKYVLDKIDGLQTMRILKRYLQKHKSIWKWEVTSSKNLRNKMITKCYQNGFLLSLTALHQIGRKFYFFSCLVTFGNCLFTFLFKIVPMKFRKFSNYDENLHFLLGKYPNCLAFAQTFDDKFVSK